MAAYVRNYAGGIVFSGRDVFLLMNDRGEWVMPKGIISNYNRSNTVALWRVEDGAGIHAEIIGIAGNTSYDYHSEARGKVVSKRVEWFVMQASDHEYKIAFEQGFLDGGYFPYERALEMIAFENDREILRRGYEIYTHLPE